jgi:hypothetical protein
VRGRSTGSDPVVLLGMSFWDQCSLWLRAGPLRDGQVEVTPVWSGAADWELRPEDLLDPGWRIYDLTTDDRCPGMVVPMSSLITEVGAARDALVELLRTSEHPAIRTAA